MKKYSPDANFIQNICNWFKDWKKVSLKNVRQVLVDRDIKFDDEVTITNTKPVRAGYEFIGWNPSVPATLTATATYTAQWANVKSGTFYFEKPNDFGLIISPSNILK